MKSPKIITTQKFIDATGRAPEQDDLGRCNCDQVGETGHWSCGWCESHDQPVLICGCIQIKREG